MVLLLLLHLLFYIKLSYKSGSFFTSFALYLTFPICVNIVSCVTMADEVVLLDFWPSLFGMRVRIALAQKGINYENKEQDQWHKSPLLLQMNPVHKMIPIESDKILITRSLIPPLKTIQYMFTHRPPQAFFVEHLPFIC